MKTIFLKIIKGVVVFAITPFIYCEDNYTIERYGPHLGLERILIVEIDRYICYSRPVIAYASPLEAVCKGL